MKIRFAKYCHMCGSFRLNGRSALKVFYSMHKCKLTETIPTSKDASLC